MLDVHHLCAYGGPYAGSFVPMLIGTARENSTRGNRTTVWLPAGAREREWVPELAQSVRVRWLPDGDGGLGQQRRVASVVHAALGAADRPTIIHSHFASFDHASLLLKATRRRTGLIWHEHGRPQHDSRSRARASVKYGVLARAVDRILCVSAQINDDLRARHAPRRALLTFPNAIDLDRFAPFDEAFRAQARRQLGIDDGVRVILHFSWHWMIKGGDLMLAAAAQLEEPGVRFITVPGPPSASPNDTLDERGQVRTAAPRDNVRELYAAADVFLSASRTEGMPYAMLEALASGMPVVASDLPGHRPALRELPGGFITDLEPASIAAGVARALSLDAPTRARHAMAARERIAAKYSLRDWARKLGDLYDAVLGLNL